MSVDSRLGDAPTTDHAQLSHSLYPAPLLLQTAIKVVQKQEAAGAAAAEAEAGEDASPTRRLEFGGGSQQQQQRGAAAGAEESLADVRNVVAYIEQGLGEVLRRLEIKVDTVASLVDQVR